MIICNRNWRYVFSVLSNRLTLTRSRKAQVGSAVDDPFACASGCGLNDAACGRNQRRTVGVNPRVQEGQAEDAGTLEPVG
jgi:hypothetical protein